MKLLIVSHTPHYPSDDGVVGWGATVRELDRLATLFRQVVHLAPVYEQAPPPSSRPYRAVNLRLRALKPAGGESLIDKMGILGGTPAFYLALADEARQADAIHVRAPANLALLTFAARGLVGRGKPWWVKYAGNWRPHGAGARAEARSYRLQRAWLRQPRRRLAVTVNGRWPEDGQHIRHFLNPCLTHGDLENARREGALKTISSPLRLLFVGRLESAKGAGRALDLLARIPDAELEMAGDGPLRAELESQAEGRGLKVQFRGWLPRAELDACYRRAHMLLLPSLASEGWPKVISEAMAWGVVPVTSDVSSMPQILDELELGAHAGAEDLPALLAGLKRLRQPDTFAAHTQRALRAAELFTYERYLDAVRRLFREQLATELGSY